jgi:hypothetical protein
MGKILPLEISRTLTNRNAVIHSRIFTNPCTTDVAGAIE